MTARTCLMGTLVWLALAPHLQAGSVTYDANLNGQGFGHTPQVTPGINNGGNACGPTATMNSFFYLQTRFGINGLGAANGHGGYNNLSNSDPGGIVNAINELGTDMGLTSGGVQDSGFVNGKTKYLQDRGLSNRISVEYESDAVNHTTPTWQFLFDQLKKGQDVEVGFVWSSGGGGHWVTATRFRFVDEDSDGTIDPGESASLDFVDPFDGNYHSGLLGMDGTHLSLTYSGGAAGVSGQGKIDIIVAESPVPLPPALWSGLSLLGLVAWRLRHSAISNR